MNEKKDSEKRKMQMLRLRQRGLTLRAIGQRYGVTRQRVQQILGPTGSASQIIERREAALLKSA